jgi:glutamyl-tRNA reductase
MSLFALGINHSTAPLEIREKVAFAPEKMVDALQQAGRDLGLEELAILSTCNRTEVYVYPAPDLQPVIEWLAKYHDVLSG